MPPREPTVSSPDEGPEDAGVAHINEHGDKYFQGILHCEWTEHKGRVLRARRTFKEGEVILAEAPLKIVQEQAQSAAFRRLKQLCSQFGDDFDYEPLWYWCALQSLTESQLEGVKAGGWEPTSEDTQFKLLLLHQDGVNEPSSSARILARELVPGADPLVVERLIQVWVLNCFEYSDEPQGYSTYWYSSFMSHSCFPNAVWHYTGTDHVLRARRNIEVGDEVCISYLPEDGLLQAAPVRRMELHETKKFWCTCERCAGVLDYSRGFRCPNCSDGVIFAHTPVSGPAENKNLLPSQIVTSVCESCGHTVSKKDAAKFGVLEGKMQKIVDDLTRRNDNEQAKKLTLEGLQEIEEFIDAHFAQHVLADLAWEQLAKNYGAKRRAADQRRILEQRCSFFERAYPGLSGSHAWALETHADALMRSSGESVASKGKDSSGRTWQVAVKADPETAYQLYLEAYRILVLMFGEEHEYVTQVARKRDNVKLPAAAGGARNPTATGTE